MTIVETNPAIYSGAGDGADAATTSPTESAESSSQFHDATRYVYTASPSFVDMARGTDGRLVLGLSHVEHR
ncbi:hypothetical protein FRC15_011247 [Serendipita sp. 397]|nr:hypothetical protein FRC15_011247 [Serendipita sp. 397]